MLNSFQPQWLKYLLWPVLFVSGLIFLFPAPIYAMHIAEGILPFNWCAIWYVVGFIFLAIGIRMMNLRIKKSRSLLPLYGLVGAAVFLISVFPIPVPISGTTSHPVGTPMAAILVGPFISIVLGAIALLIQALFMAHGGISTWGANIASMAVAGSFVGFGIFFLARRFKAPVFVAGLLAGMLGDWAVYGLDSYMLAAALHGSNSVWSMFQVVALAFAPTQLPLGVLEGLFTGGVVVFLYKRRPDLLFHLFPKKVPGEAGG
jgi:cobalt/nickel transport system permease protein